MTLLAKKAFWGDFDKIRTRPSTRFVMGTDMFSMETVLTPEQFLVVSTGE
jgi:hypothetical protein